MSAVPAVSRAEPYGTDFPDVLVAARAGGAWALRVLYEGLAASVHGYIRGQGVADPQGLTNDVFSRVFRRITTFDGDAAAFRSWVFTIAHNAVIDERRRAGRRIAEVGPLPEGEHAGMVSSAEDEALAAIGEERVQQLLGLLPADQREVLVLRLVSDLTVAEIARMHGRSIGATKALQRRGLNRLRRILDEGVPL